MKSYSTDLAGVPVYVVPHYAPGTLKIDNGKVYTDSWETVRRDVTNWNAEATDDQKIIYGTETFAALCTTLRPELSRVMHNE